MVRTRSTRQRCCRPSTTWTTSSNGSPRRLISPPHPIGVVNPQIKVTKIAPQQADVCDNIEYRYTVTNIGTGSTERVIVREDLPEGLTTQDGRNQVVLDAGRIEAGQTKEGVVRLKASRGLVRRPRIATGDGGLQAQTDDVTLRVTQPKLAVNIEGPENEYVNRPIAYRVTVTNEGDAPARDATIAVPIPASTKIANVGTEGRADRSAIQWNLGTLEPRQQDGDVQPHRHGGSRCWRPAQRHARARRGVSGVARTKVMTIAALLLETVDLSDPVRVGENVVYRITVTNQGSGPDTNIRVTAKVPARGAVRLGEGRDRGDRAKATDVVRFAPIATLAPGRGAEWEADRDRQAGGRHALRGAAGERFADQAGLERTSRPGCTNAAVESESGLLTTATARQKCPASPSLD